MVGGGLHRCFGCWGLLFIVGALCEGGFLDGLWVGMWGRHE